MKNDVKSDPCENCIFEEGSRYCIEHCPYEAEVEPKSCDCKDVVDCEYCDEDGFCQYNKLCISQRSVCNKFIDKQQSCNDTISREAILDKYKSCADMLSDEELVGAELVIGWIKEESSVIPKSIECEDVISREDARMSLTCEIKEGMTIEDYILMVDTRLKMLSNVQPICKEREKGECPWYAG